MIPVMMRRDQNISAILPATLWLFSFLSEPGPLIAHMGNKSLAHQSTPKLNVLVYNHARVSAKTLYGAEIEAMRMLHGASIELNWMDCNSGAPPASCLSLPQPTDLIIHLLPQARFGVTKTTLGITASTNGQTGAFIFYDRVRALRTSGSFLQSILGRILAHEVVHLLLPEQDHTNLGLMRKRWTTDDLQMKSLECLGLPTRYARLMEDEAHRRELSAGVCFQKRIDTSASQLSR